MKRYKIFLIITLFISSFIFLSLYLRGYPGFDIGRYIYYINQFNNSNFYDKLVILMNDIPGIPNYIFYYIFTGGGIINPISIIPFYCLFFFIITCFLIIKISKLMFNSEKLSIFSGLLFALSPTQLNLFSTVLKQNISICFFLFSFYILISIFKKPEYMNILNQNKGKFIKIVDNFRKNKKDFIKFIIAIIFNIISISYYFILLIESVIIIAFLFTSPNKITRYICYIFLIIVSLGILILRDFFIVNFAANQLYFIFMGEDYAQFLPILDLKTISRTIPFIIYFPFLGIFIIYYIKRWINKGKYDYQFHLLIIIVCTFLLFTIGGNLGVLNFYYAGRITQLFEIFFIIICPKSVKLLIDYISSKKGLNFRHQAFNDFYNRLSTIFLALLVLNISLTYLSISDPVLNYEEREGILFLKKNYKDLSQSIIIVDHKLYFWTSNLLEIDIVNFKVNDYLIDQGIISLRNLINFQDQKLNNSEIISRLEMSTYCVENISLFIIKSKGIEIWTQLSNYGEFELHDFFNFVILRNHQLILIYENTDILISQLFLY